MNRALLKQDAKDAMKMASPHPALTTLVMFAVAMAGAFVLNIFGGILGFTGAITGSGAFSLLIGTVQFGYYSYCLRVFKQQDVGISELFSYFPMLFKVFGLSLWMALFIWLWSLLCFIPGIIAALRYSQAFFILAENPDMSIRDCVNESKLLMSGRLWELFVLQLSFIPWILLVSITCGLAGLYVQPYMVTTLAGYYLSLKPDDGTYQNDAEPGYGTPSQI